MTKGNLYGYMESFVELSHGLADTNPTFPRHSGTHFFGRVSCHYPVIIHELLELKMFKEARVAVRSLQFCLHI